MMCQSGNCSTCRYSMESDKKIPKYKVVFDGCGIEKRLTETELREFIDDKMQRCQLHDGPRHPLWGCAPRKTTLADFKVTEVRDVKLTMKMLLEIS